jgi:hypothetical protein
MPRSPSLNLHPFQTDTTVCGERAQTTQNCQNFGQVS